MLQRRVTRIGICVLGVVLVFGISGCMATESQSGDTFIYKKSILNTLLLFCIAATLLVFGAGILRESLQTKKPRKKKRSAGDSRRRKPAPASSSNKKYGGIAFGSGLLLGGTLILLLGVPSSLVQHITVSKDKVVMRLSVLWFARGNREIPFSSITGIEKIEQEVATRRGKRTDETLVLHLAGGTEYIEMGPLEKAAFPKLIEMLEAYREDAGQADGQQVGENAPQGSGEETQIVLNQFFNKSGANITAANEAERAAEDIRNADAISRRLPPQDQSPDNPTPPPVAKNAGVPIDTSNLTPVEHIGRFFKNGSAMVNGLDPTRPGYTLAYIVEVYAEGKLKVLHYKAEPGNEVLVDLADVRPSGSTYVPRGFGPGTQIDSSNPPAPGTKLLAFHASRWFEVEFVRMEGKSPVIKWPRERGLNIATHEMVRVPPAEGTKPYDGKRYNPPTDEGLTPREQRGMYAKGNEFYFKEGATRRKVVLVQLYREPVIKVQDVETGEVFYAFSSELDRTP